MISNEPRSRRLGCVGRTLKAGPLWQPVPINKTTTQETHLIDNSVAIFVDSGASEHYLLYFDDTPGLRKILSDGDNLEEPHKIITPGKHQPEGSDRGVIPGAIIDKAGVKKPVKIPVVVVPSLGRKFYSVSQATL